MIFKNHIKVMLEKEPTSTAKEMKSWLMSGQQKFDLTLVNPSTLRMFIERSMSKFLALGTMDRKAVSGGTNKISMKEIIKIKRLALNKKRRSIRRVGAMVGVSKNTVNRYLWKSGAKPYHRRKVQVMKPEHRKKRVHFGRWALQEFGTDVNGNTVWRGLVNTDFSAMVKKNDSLNTKNDVVWSKSKDDAGELLDFGQEKYDDSFMMINHLN